MSNSKALNYTSRSSKQSRTKVGGALSSTKNSDLVSIMDKEVQPKKEVEKPKETEDEFKERMK